MRLPAIRSGTRRRSSKFSAAASFQVTALEDQYRSAQSHGGVEQGIQSVLQDKLPGDRLFVRDRTDHVESREIRHEVGRARSQQTGYPMSHAREIAQVFGEASDHE